MNTEIDSWIEKHTTQGAFCPIISATVGDFRALFAGKVLVPVEPDATMITKGTHVNSEWLNDNAPIGERRYREPAIAVYKAMITASQEPKQ